VNRNAPSAGARTALTVALLLAGTCLALLLPLSRNGFVFDDRAFILGEPNLTGGLTARGAAWALRDATAGMYVPVARLSHQLDFQLHGLSPGGHHVTSLLLHAANAALLFLALAGLTGAPGRSAAVAALFAVHPLNVETVAWISARADLLAAFFGLLALLAWTRHLRHPGRGWSLAAAAAFLLGMLSKATVMTLPLLLLALDAWPLGRLRRLPARPGRRGSARHGGLIAALGEKWLLLGVAATLVSVSLLLLRSRSLAVSVAEYPLAARAATVLVSYAGYLGKALWPARLAVFYPHRWGNLPWWQPAGAAALLLAVTAAAVALRRRQPWLAVGWAWFLGALLPVIGLYQARDYSMADRYAYLPLMGLLVALVWGAADLARRLPGGRLAGAALCAAALLACLPASRAQARRWRDDLTLFSHALAVTDDNWIARYSVGLELHRRGATAEARAQMLEAVRIRPQYAPAQNGLGEILVGEGDLAGGAERFARALALEPDFPEALGNLGVVAQRQGRPAEAEELYRRALRLKPALPQTLNNLGVLLEAGGRAEEAVASYRAALGWDPDYADALVNLGVALVGAGREAEGEGFLRRAVAVAPASVDARNNWGVLLERQGRLAEAEAQYREALRLRPGFEDARRNLARLLQGRGAPTAAR
jgi:Tfp pilus assembly protein PilF